MMVICRTKLNLIMCPMAAGIFIASFGSTAAPPLEFSGRASLEGINREIAVQSKDNNATSVKGTREAFWRFEVSKTDQGSWFRKHLISTHMFKEVLFFTWEEIEPITSEPGCWNFCSPLMIDTNQDGFHFGDAGIGVYFDILGNGTQLELQWVSENSDDAFLFMDINHNGLVDNGSELFGNGHRILNTGELASNGYYALAQYDAAEHGGNDDGVITDQDQVWNSLGLWIDINADGYSTTNEIYTLSERGIKSIDIGYKKSKKRIDHAGNLLPFWSWVTTDNQEGSPNKMRMVDVFFKVLSRQ